MSEETAVRGHWRTRETLMAGMTTCIVGVAIIAVAALVVGVAAPATGLIGPGSMAVVACSGFGACLLVIRRQHSELLAAHEEIASLHEQLATGGSPEPGV